MCRECDRTHIRRTLDLARMGEGSVAPNPMVGAVITRNGRVVAEGYHQSYGGLHAEAEALQRAGSRSRGATLYCNLEPCSYTAPDKHQPACTGRIIDAGIRRVVVAQLDPNPRVRGRGIARLRAAGIEVSVLEGELSEQAWEFNERFNTWMALARPWVHLKAAISLDGCLATASGDAAWITDGDARSQAHAMRARVDGVMVGRGTVMADDPLLTTRLAAGPDARPVVVDSGLRIPDTTRLLRERAGDLVVCCSSRALAGPVADRADRLRARGVTILDVAPNPDGAGLDPEDLLRRLGGAGIRSLLVEGGGALVTSLIAADLYDRLSLFIAPVLIGAGIPFLSDIGVRRMGEAIRPVAVQWERIGDQQLVRVRNPSWMRRVTQACAADPGAPESLATEREVADVYRAG